MNRFRHLASAFGLALALLLGQHAAALHDIAHASESHWQKHDGKRGPVHCDENLACASMAGAAAAFVPTLPLVAAQAGAPSILTDSPAPAAARLAYRSQAPPLFLL
jgi:hypothetical protein